MAKFPALTLTKAGQNMLIKSGTGRSEDRLIFTKAVLGSGELRGRNIRDLTAVLEPKITVTVSEYIQSPNKSGQAVLVFKYTNESVDVGFRHREVGIFAKNGDLGTETLFGYTNAGANDGYIDDKTTPIPVQTLRVGVSISDNANATAVIDMTNAITLEQLKSHDQNPNAHGAVITKALEGLKTHKEQDVLDHPDGCVTTEKLKDGAVTTDKIANIHRNGSTYAYVTYNRAGQITSGTNTINATVNYGYSPTVPTPSTNDDSMKAANTSFVQRAIKGLKSYVDDEIAKLKKYVDGKVQEVVGALDGRKIVSKLTSDILGVRANIAENGYICFGPLFFGLIIQWGRYSNPSNTLSVVALPIAFKSRGFFGNAVQHKENTNGNMTTIVADITKTHIKYGFPGYNGYIYGVPSYWFAIGV